MSVVGRRPDFTTQPRHTATSDTSKNLLETMRTARMHCSLKMTHRLRRPTVAVRRTAVTRSAFITRCRRVSPQSAGVLGHGPSGISGASDVCMPVPASHTTDPEGCLRRRRPRSCCQRCCRPPRAARPSCTARHRRLQLITAVLRQMTSSQIDDIGQL